MKKDTQYIISAILIFIFAFAFFNLDITGFMSKDKGMINIALTDGFGNSKSVFERGNILKAVVSVEDTSVENRYMWIYRDKPQGMLRVQGTSKMICGTGKADCSDGEYEVTYRIEDTIHKFGDGKYYVRVQEHNGDYIFKEFTIDGPYLGAYREGLKYP